MRGTKSPRRQHYIPAFYLSSFTEGQSRHAKFHVFDLKSGIFRKSKPHNEAHERDFNFLETESGVSTLLDSEIQKLETEAARVLNVIKDTNTFPNPEDWGLFFYFMAIISGNHPVKRNSVEDFKLQVLDKILDMFVNTPEFYESQIKKAKDEGYFSDVKDIPYKEMKEFVEKRKFDIEVGKNYIVQSVFKMVEVILEHLTLRKWTLLLNDGPADFITCDHPAALTWMSFDPNDLRRPVGFGLEGTEFTFPIGPRHALRAVHNDNMPPIVRINDRGVALVNRNTILSASRWLYCRKPEFVWMPNKGVLESSTELIRKIKCRPSR